MASSYRFREAFASPRTLWASLRSGIEKDQAVKIRDGLFEPSESQVHEPAPEVRVGVFGVEAYGPAVFGYRFPVPQELFFLMAPDQIEFRILWVETDCPVKIGDRLPVQPEQDFNESAVEVSSRVL